jgi:hypothetical protein
MAGEVHMTICESIATDYPQIADGVREREIVGMDRYGAPLDPLTDPRNFYIDADEELLDATVYGRAIRERGEYLSPAYEYHVLAAIEALRLSRAIEGR